MSPSSAVKNNCPCPVFVRIGQILRAESPVSIEIILLYLLTRVRPRFFDQVEHQTTNASIGNKHFSTK